MSPSLLNRKPKIDPDAIYVSLDGFAAEVPGDALLQHFAVTRGTRLRGSHPAVQRYPGLFAADGLDDFELARARDAIAPAEPQ